ncbi:MAG: DUF72 domain-containing protein [Actinomycetota bacterium]
MAQGKIYIGTSGYSYNNWKGDFYPDNLSKGEWLSFYAQKFNSVEINSSFYHLPARKTFQKWAGQTPRDFIFSVKASRYITHMKKLKDPKEPLGKLMERASGLGGKLGPVLFQLPANQKKDAAKLRNFLKACEKLNSVFEFRDRSWFDEEIYEILDNYGCGIVVSSGPDFPYTEKITGSLCYIRLHGKEKLYHSSYSDDELKKYAGIALECKVKGKDCYIYFNNDALGHAFRNAAAISKMLL